MTDLGLERAYVVAPVADAYPLAENVEVLSMIALADAIIGGGF